LADSRSSKGKCLKEPLTKCFSGDSATSATLESVSPPDICIYSERIPGRAKVIVVCSECISEINIEDVWGYETEYC